MTERNLHSISKAMSCPSGIWQPCSEAHVIHDNNSNCYGCLAPGTELYFHSTNVVACIVNISYVSVYGSYNISARRTIFLNAFGLNAESKLYGACYGGSSVTSSSIKIGARDVNENSLVCGACYWKNSDVHIAASSIYNSKIIGAHESHIRNIIISGNNLSHAEVYGVCDNSQASKIKIFIANFFDGFLCVVKGQSSSSVIDLFLMNIARVTVVGHDESSHSDSVTIKASRCSGCKFIAGSGNDSIDISGTNFTITSYLSTCSCYLDGNDTITVGVVRGWNFIYYDNPSTHQSISSSTSDPKSIHLWQTTGPMDAKTNAGQYYIKTGHCSSFHIGQAESVVRIINFDPKCDKIMDHPPIENSSDKIEDHFYDLRFNASDFNAPESTGAIQLEGGGSSCFVRCFGELSIIFQNITCSEIDIQ